ncbi:hypothetical protein VKS41_003120 [Umbelopsis sp. WA50703]|jgi:hypothetical protein
MAAATRRNKRAADDLPSDSSSDEDQSTAKLLKSNSGAAIATTFQSDSVLQADINGYKFDNLAANVFNSLSANLTF